MSGLKNGRLFLGFGKLASEGQHKYRITIYSEWIASLLSQGQDRTKIPLKKSQNNTIIFAFYNKKVYN
ncbi:MAG: hypothetical protein WC850_02270 [Candidatus Gracilibacteria bacterium]